MKYYLAIKQDSYPFIRWTEVAQFETIEDFNKSEWASNPLVKEKADIIQVFGTYSYHIVDGEFVDRTEENMAELQKDFDAKNALDSNINKIESINSDSFRFDRNEFPMDEVSRLFYAMIAVKPNDYSIQTMDYSKYDLSSENNTDFLKAYQDKLLSISRHK